jgi:hypothetical protein
MVKETDMLLDKKGHARTIHLLKHAYELDLKIKKLKAELEPIRKEIKEYMEAKKTTVLYHHDISARIQHRSGYLKWDTDKIKLIVGERFDEFKGECSKMTAASKALSIELVEDKEEKVG